MEIRSVKNSEAALRTTALLRPLETNSFDSTMINKLYTEEQLTSEEFVVLDFLGALTTVSDLVEQEGDLIVSFQGLKRKINLHQARLTKALKRLSEKDLIQKTENGYQITETGLLLSLKLADKFQSLKRFNENIVTHVISGTLTSNIEMDKQGLKELGEQFVGKWFGDFRFVSKTEYDDSFEIEWISTTGSLSSKLVLGPKNSISLSLSSKSYIDGELEIQIMKDRITTTLQQISDISPVFISYNIYEDTKKLEGSETIGSIFAA